MGKVGITVKVLPEDPEVDLNKIKEEILKLKEKLKADDIRVEERPIAFGLKELIVGIVRDDELGEEGIIEEISKIEGVGEVDIVNVTLV